jgi:hypothetical protein
MHDPRKEKAMNRIGALRCLLAVAAVFLVAIAPATASAVPPSNDNFANAETITERFGYAYGENTDATKEAGEPNHAGNPGGASIWFVWTAPYAGRMTLDLCYSEFDTLLAVYTGDQLANLQQVAADDNGCGEQSRLSFTTVAGETYRIAVDGTDGATGFYELDWGLGPPNDDFAQAVGITGDQGSVEGDNYAATRESGEPEHGPSGGGSVWYRWTAPSSGPVSFDSAPATSTRCLLSTPVRSWMGFHRWRKTTTTAMGTPGAAFRSWPREARRTALR